MTSSIIRSTASGSTADFSVPFAYLDRTHVQVRLNGVLKALGTDYSFTTDSLIHFTAGNPASGTVVERKRVTPTDPLTDFTPGNLDTGDLNVGILQPLYLAQEGNDAAADILLRAWFTTNFGNGGTITVGPDGTILIWDASGNVVVGPSATDIEGYSAAAQAAQVAAEAARDTASGSAATAVAAATSAATANLPNPGVANSFLQRNAGNTAYVVKTGTEVRDYIQANKPYNVLWAGADPTNTLDCTAAFIAAEANGEIYIPDGSYKIATNWSPTVGVRRSSGAKFFIANGVTVDLTAASFEDKAHKKQCFYITGTGAVAGLQQSHAGWFAGDKLNGATNALPELQKWADSVVTNGTLYQSLGVYISDGSAYIECTKSQRVKGRNRSLSILRFSGTASRGYRFSTASAYHFVSDLGFDRSLGLVAPTVGACLLFDSGARGLVEGIYTSACYTGVQANSGWFSGKRMLLIDTLFSGLYINNGNESHARDSIISANSSWVTLTGITGTFATSETVTFSGGSGTLFRDGANNFKAIFTATQPTIGQVLTGSTSGATGTLATRINGHTTGGIRIFNACQAGLFESVEVSGGDYGLAMDANANTAASRNLTNVFTGCLFDSAIQAGALVQNSAGTRFLGCWFSSFGNANGVYLQETITTTLTDCEWSYVGARCVLCNTNAKDTQITGGLMADINASNLANMPAIQFINGTTGVVRDVTIGTSLGYGPNNPVRGIQVDAGATNVLIDNVDVSLCGTPIVDAGSGTVLRNVRGYKTRSSGTGTMNAGTGGIVVNHGLAIAPTRVLITPTSDTGAVRYFISAKTATTFTLSVNTTTGLNAFTFDWQAVAGDQNA